MSDIVKKSLISDKSMDYPVQLSSQLKQLLKSLRKSRQMTQAELAQRLGVVQSRVADIERDPGAVSVDQLLQVLAMLGAQVVVRQTGQPLPTSKPAIDSEAPSEAKSPPTGKLMDGTKSATPKSDVAPDNQLDDKPRGQW